MRSLALFAASLLASTIVAAPVPKEKPKLKDDEAIVGTWSIEKFDTAGAQGTPPAEVVSAIRFVFAEKGGFNMIGTPSEKKDGTFKLDPEAKIKTLDIAIDGKKMLGLYELDGDTLTLCIPNSEDLPRPVEIKADAKARVAVVTFKRQKDEKKDK